jgi:hypothetical protein
MTEAEQDTGKGPAGVAQRWIAELDLAEREEAEWRRRGKRVIQRYKDERKNGKGNANAALIDQRKFSILWSNVQTLGPAIYARTPNAVVSRRFKDADPVGRQASEVLERAANFSLEEYDFDYQMVQVRQDYLLPGRGTVWLRYVPTMKDVRVGLEDGRDPTGKEIEPEEIEEDEDGQFMTDEMVDYEQVFCEHVAWDDFVTSSAREWNEVRWVARRVFLTRDELIDRFGEKIGKAVPLDWLPKGASKDKSESEDYFKKSQVYEIWDRTSKKAYWINKSYSEEPLDVRDDPLKLKDFFPCPRPVLATTGQDSMIPVPDYALYQDQAEELDELTAKMGFLIDALRMVGMYNAVNKVELARVFSPGNENKLIPIEGWTSFQEGGGAKGSIEWVPIDMVIQTLQGCIETRRQVIEDIYQITGISDILRGDTDARETLGAQQIKAQWGSLRVRDRQREMARFARDVIRMKAEIIGEHFSLETLKAMTGVKMLDDQAQKQQLQQQIQMQQQQAQAQGQQAPPIPDDVTQILERPTWEEVMALIRDNAMRSFRVEIESDSTIEPDEQAQKASAVEFLTTIGTLISNAGPMVQMAPPLGKLVGEGVKFVTRRFRIGREMEETIDQVMDEISQMPAAPPPGSEVDQSGTQIAQIDAQSEQIKAQAMLQGKQMDAQMQQQEIPIRMAELQLKQAAMQRDPDPQVAA